MEGKKVGERLGADEIVGLLLGVSVGLALGADDGTMEGASLGSSDISTRALTTDGAAELGEEVRRALIGSSKSAGSVVGPVGIIDGDPEGSKDGRSLGRFVAMLNSEYSSITTMASIISAISSSSCRVSSIISFS